MRLIMKVVLQVAGLYGFYYIGTLIQGWLGLPVPGSILGLVLLLVLLLTGILPVEWIDHGAGFMLAYLPLFFVPVTVGIIEYPILLSKTGILMIVMTITGTWLTMFAAGFTSEKLSKQKEEA
ncbi:CidA/LrgA family protein [Salimicrobium sp. PL1-032A]|uniref:CidA/LrgA family protein n=1 Tax=Salimicrobium sp. PL1-032A TaxID=3095364 RepID=UPI0032610F5D